MTTAFAQIDAAAAEIVTAIYGPVAYPNQDDRQVQTLAIMRAHGVHEDLIALVLERVMTLFEDRLLRICAEADRPSSSNEAA